MHTTSVSFSYTITHTGGAHAICLHESASPELISTVPVGTLAHRNYLCPSLKTERSKHAPSSLLQRALGQADGNIAFERALLPSQAGLVPPPSKDATFRWKIEPPGGTFCGKVYSDGSRLDGPSPLLARNGWAFVVVDDNNTIIAAASGVPPDWVEDIPGPKPGHSPKQLCVLSRAAPSSLIASHVSKQSMPTPTSPVPTTSPWLGSTASCTVH